MRLDKFLVVARLVKQRTRAKELCDAGHVKIGGKSAKAAHAVTEGEVIELTLPRRRLVVAVEAVPAAKSVPKAEAPTLYKILEDERTDRLE
ncbi:MAG: RNA-binding S4 domain-containing protein [Candidatus Coatesbacteria bacterium]|nr:MAG: RNA-binding S4 domain-containing protein [Candidatus Coatesbacteria bacterium]